MKPENTKDFKFESLKLTLNWIWSRNFKTWVTASFSNVSSFLNLMLYFQSVRNKEEFSNLTISTFSLWFSLTKHKIKMTIGGLLVQNVLHLEIGGSILNRKRVLTVNWLRVWISCCLLQSFTSFTLDLISGDFKPFWVNLEI